MANTTLFLATILLGVAYVMAEHGWGHEAGGHGGGGGGGDVGGHGGHHEGWGWSHPKYKYSYGVKDSHTKDHKEASEWRDGDAVKGHYSLLEPDGSWRTVTYTADKGGFKAHVHRTPNHHGGWEKH
ncbi:cuticle protein 8 [Folsomia candida]|uniref:Cuticle protein 8 n=1 Tax=Folsomia candida TaxID=158441 RepID=A0A226DZA3_FOLCA|nr:cuticle protein 8 [Folsomia candida]OXA50815.1 Cuticle protein 8 [Folsomia candida]